MKQRELLEDTLTFQALLFLRHPDIPSDVWATPREIIEQTSFSRTKTARDLGISRVTLYNKMRKYDLLKAD